MKKLYIIVLVYFSISAFAQNTNKDKGVFIDKKPGYWENDILRGIEKYQEKPDVKVISKFKIDNSGKTFPNNIDLYKKYWHNAPVSQGSTGTCWSFSTTSYFESEVYRLTKQEIKLSEMYSVYWEYVEKAKRFVKEKGNSFFGEGSESDAIIRLWKVYGIVPVSAYSGMKEGQTFHYHDKMFEEMDNYLKSVKASNSWNEEIVISTIKSILNSYIGAPPTKINVNGKEVTPQEYLKNTLKINFDDYFSVYSQMKKPYWQKVESDVEDNWWHSKEYYNVPLEDFMAILKKAIRSGYTIAIGGDISEAGIDLTNQIAVIPTFDIPSEYIDESARQFRISNNTTTDDHGIHLVGFYEKDGKDWYLIKDSGSASRNGDKNSKTFGYFFFSEDFVKLKMLDFMVNKDMFKDYLSRFK